LRGPSSLRWLWIPGSRRSAPHDAQSRIGNAVVQWLLRAIMINITTEHDTWSDQHSAAVETETSLDRAVPFLHRRLPINNLEFREQAC
jgi:hypothetical protein